MKYDVAILGGGAAGLSLANHLASATGGGVKTLLVEKRATYENDRTWCFWEKPERLPAFCEPAYQWGSWSFSAGRQSASQASRQFGYHCLPSVDFYRSSLNRVEGSENVEAWLGTEANLKSKDDLAELWVGGEKVDAEYLIDCRPPDRTRVAESLLVQTFVGADVKCDREVFNPQQAELMTHLQAEETGFFFTYVLPYSASRALVEVTAVSCPKQGRQASREELRAHLDDRLGKDRYRIERFEAGRLPMGLPTLPAKAAANLWRAGTQGGALRMSSGYAFLRIQRWAEREAGRLKAGLPPQGHPRPSFVEKYLDPLFLQVLRHQPELAPEIFMKLGNQMSADRFVRFMIDEPQVADLAQLIAVLPKVPFMKQLARGFLRHPAGHASSSVSSRHG